MYKDTFQFCKGPGDFLGFVFDHLLGPIIGFIIGGILGMIIDIVISICIIIKNGNGLGIISSAKTMMVQITNNQIGLTKKILTVLSFGTKMTSTIVGIVIISSLIAKIYIFGADTIASLLEELIFGTIGDNFLGYLLIFFLSVFLCGVFPIYGIIVLLSKVAYEKNIVTEVFVCLLCSKILLLDYLIKIILSL